jgi:galactokinase
VNLIGEHTDYNDGFVMPMAIDPSAWVSIAPVAERKLSIYSEEFREQVAFDLDDHKPAAQGHWSNYVRGVAVALEQAGHRLRGARIHIRSDVPIGAGLSSSAAIEVAAAYALLANSDISMARRDIVRLCQRAENVFVGARCGIMDQFVSCYGQEGKALLLDCRSLEYKLLPLPEHLRLVIFNTMVKHELSNGAYNQRRAECEVGVRHLAKTLPGVTALRDVTLAELELHGRDLPEEIYRRCHHVISENARVLEVAAALEGGDLDWSGQLLDESHRSLREDYEVSCAELDLMVELARQVPGVYGARMTGGGFGGCIVTLAGTESVDELQSFVGKNYAKATGISPVESYVFKAANGAEEVTTQS